MAVNEVARSTWKRGTSSSAPRSCPNSKTTRSAPGWWPTRTSVSAWSPEARPPAGIGGHAVVGVRVGVGDGVIVGEGLATTTTVAVGRAVAVAAAVRAGDAVGDGSPSRGRAKTIESPTMTAIRTTRSAERTITVAA
jgi:hypothetical protein